MPALSQQLKPLIAAIEKLLPGNASEELGFDEIKKRREIVEKDILPQLFGKPPHYSCGYKVSNVTTATTGAFCVPYFIDSEGQCRVILIQRGSRESYDSGVKLGVPGGYVDFDAKEQPQQDVLREMFEELKNSEGKFIIPSHTPIDAERLRPLHSCIDYRQTYPLSVPTVATGYSLPLKEGEYKIIAEHGKKLREDMQYRNKAVKHTKGEVVGVEIWPLEKVLALGKRNPEMFSHKHEFEAMQRLNAQLYPGVEKIR